MRDLSEKLRGAKQTRAMMQNSSGNTSPKEKSLTAYLTEKTVRHNNKMMIIQNNTYTARRAMLWRDSLPG